MRRFAQSGLAAFFSVIGIALLTAQAANVHVRLGFGPSEGFLQQALGALQQFAVGELLRSPY